MTEEVKSILDVSRYGIFYHQVENRIGLVHSGGIKSIDAINFGPRRNWRGGYGELGYGFYCGYNYRVAAFHRSGPYCVMLYLDVNELDGKPFKSYLYSDSIISWNDSGNLSTLTEHSDFRRSGSTFVFSIGGQVVFKDPCGLHIIECLPRATLGNILYYLTLVTYIMRMLELGYEYYLAGSFFNKISSIVPAMTLGSVKTIDEMRKCFNELCSEYDVTLLVSKVDSWMEKYEKYY